jgi:hypothetical protein
LADNGSCCPLLKCIETVLFFIDSPKLNVFLAKIPRQIQVSYRRCFVPVHGLVLTTNV